MFEWIAHQFQLAMDHYELRIALVGMLLGVAWTDFVPRLLPDDLDARYAARLTRLIVFGTVTTLSFFLNPSPLGFVFALIAGSGSPAVQALMMRALYAKWPAMKPQSLMDCPDDKPPPPSLVKP